MQIRLLSEHFGAEISGVNLAAGLPDDIFEEIDDAYNRYSVLPMRAGPGTPTCPTQRGRRAGHCCTPLEFRSRMAVRSVIRFLRVPPLSVLFTSVNRKIESKNALVISGPLQHLAMTQCPPGIVVAGAPMFLHADA